jgi:hypothetical protein
VIAHVTMSARFTPQQFGAEMAAAGGDFTVLSDTVAERDASLPLADQLDALRPRLLNESQPPGGGAAGASATPLSTPSLSPLRSTGRRLPRRTPWSRFSINWPPPTAHCLAST